LKPRVWIDLDSVIYDLHTPWLSQHNAEYPNHILRIEDHKGWDAQKACNDVNCGANIYSYFNKPETWLNGKPIDNCVEVIERWQQEDIADIGILTTTPNALAAQLKLQWINQYLPTIKDVIIVNGHLKHLIVGDVLIDDGIHNLENFNGLKILYNQSWNQDSNFVRANNWTEVDMMVRTAIVIVNAVETFYKEHN
jgi:5'-nucleotidase